MLKRRDKDDVSLERYLSRLLHLLGKREGVSLSTNEFAATLDAAFDDPTLRLDMAGLRELAATQGVAAWQRQLAQQIVDLREIAEAGTLDDPQRYFGIDAPRGARWYNFDSHSFVECGMTGSFGGWTPCDDSDRALVPGQVAVLGEDGTYSSVDSADIEEPIHVITEISWDDVAEFLWAGQNYE